MLLLAMYGWWVNEKGEFLSGGVSTAIKHSNQGDYILKICILSFML